MKRNFVLRGNALCIRTEECLRERLMLFSSLPALIIVMLMFSALKPQAQVQVVCSNPGSLISNTVTSTTDQIIMTTGSTDVITDMNIYVLLTHTYISDLTIELQSPSGTAITLFSGNCGGLDDMDATFDDAGGALLCPPVGTMAPDQTLAALIGESIDGTWTLTITDNFAGDDGTLTEWCLNATLGPPPPPVPNDECADAIVIGCGETMSGTTTDAIADAVGLCGTSATAPGVFYTFIGTGDAITVSLCGAGTDYDSKLGVFEGDCAGLICVDGNDDFCSLASEVTFTSVLGTVYFFYVHGFNASTGNFDIAVTCDDGSGGGGGTCSAPGSLITDILPTTTDQITMATGSTDVITDMNVSIDITHTYISDLVITLQSPLGTSITLFNGSCGSSDNMDALFDDGTGAIACPPIGTFSPAQGLAAFIGENVDGTWTLSITDNFAGDDGSLNEWCLIPTLGIPVSIPNDDCANAIAVACDQVVTGTTVGSTEDNAGTCGTDNTSPGVWYSFAGTGDFVTASTCGTATFDTKLSVFSGSCGALTCVGGNDDFSGCGLTSQVGFLSEVGTDYFILVHGFLGETGSFDLSFTCTPITVANDLCSGALPFACGETITGSTVDATPEGEAPCGVSNTAPGVWYKFTGDGSLVTATTCNAGNLFDTKISVFEGACGSLLCVAGNDDDGGCAVDPFFSTVSWVANTGTDYFILVHGFGTATGTFEMSASCGTPLANDNCTDVSPVDVTNGTSVTFNGTTAGATQNSFETTEFGYNIVWEAFTLSASCSNVSIAYCGSISPTFNIFARLYTDCASNSFIEDSDGQPNDVACGDGNLT